jgi:hypothetical protein
MILEGRSAFNRKLGLNIDENQLTLNTKITPPIICQSGKGYL